MAASSYLVTYAEQTELKGGMALVSINVVVLRQAWLVLGWVTVCGRVNHLST